MACLSLSADSMPESRKDLQHVQLQYEEQGGESVAFVQSKPLTTEERELLIHTSPLPAEGAKILLHSCCAPCSGAMVEEMYEKMKLDVTIFFYNPNIHPKKEYEIRKEENKRYAKKHGIPFVDCDYDADSWFKRMVGFELEPA